MSKNQTIVAVSLLFSFKQANKSPILLWIKPLELKCCIYLTDMYMII